MANQDFETQELAKRLQWIRLVAESPTLDDLLHRIPLLSRRFDRLHLCGIALRETRNNVDWVWMRVFDTTRLDSDSLSADGLSEIDRSAKAGMLLDESPAGRVLETGEAMHFNDLTDTTSFPRALRKYRRVGVRSLVYLPLKTARSFPGALVCGSRHPNAFANGLLESLREMSDILALTLETSLALESAARERQAAEAERNRLKVLLRIARSMAAEYEVDRVRELIMRELYQYVPHRFGSVCAYEPDQKNLRMLYVDVVDEKVSREIGATIPIEHTVSGAAYQEGGPVFFRLGQDDNRFPYSANIVRRYKSHWMCALPLQTAKGKLGVINIGGVKNHEPTEDDLAFLGELAYHLSLAMERARVLDDMRSRTEELEREKLALSQEIEEELSFEEIVGRSSALKVVLGGIKAVADTDATVLIQGESGTGKELVARAIHARSSRHARPFVKVSCAAIPHGLLESELFGHEKGAFTGATAMRQGRFELAHRGTILLDEIGDLPLSLQAKLLRVLQERQFERLGSSVTSTVDVRVLAATHRDLKAMVAAGEFREDLYYRLNTFPITVPPLRERHGDVPLLIRFFVQQLSRKLGRNVRKIPEFAMRAMQRYHWPGNVRELQNFVERAVILSRSDTLNPPLAELEEQSTNPNRVPLTMEEAERKAILRALEESRWIIGGSRGAAAALGMKRTTLQSRMKKLGIHREAGHDEPVL